MVPLGVKVVDIGSRFHCHSRVSMKPVKEMFKGKQGDGFLIYLTTT
jgi:hypothetical protein